MTKPSFYLLIAAVLIVAGLTARSVNARHTKELTQVVVAADRVGKPTAAATTALTNYASSHMGASANWALGGSYDRALAAAKAASAAVSAASSQVYAEAQKACTGHSDSIAQARCNAAYLQAHQPPPVSAPPAPKLSDYQHSASSPPWTPDLAGALFAGAAASLLVAGAVAVGARR